ncbi:MAG: TIGR00730 family Rossman fold protein [Bacteroidales bacterium]|nr:TIGR00730 family Rossman fold protein [Bacteroidales bacterium]
MKIAVFCGSSNPKNRKYLDDAKLLGRRIAKSGHTLVYGGSNLGMMGAVSGAALECGGTVIGVIPTLFSEEIIMSQPVTELVRVSSMAERKEYIIRESDAFVALPGGIGTLDEVLEVLVANQLKQIKKTIALYNPDGFYDSFLEQIKQMGTNGFFRSGAEPEIINCKEINDCVDGLYLTQ